MKTLFASLLVLSLVNFANAKTLNPPVSSKVPEFCKLQNEDVDVNALYAQQTIPVHKAKSLTAFQFSLVQAYVSGIKEIHTMEDLRKMFGKDGELDDLYRSEEHTSELQSH